MKRVIINALTAILLMLAQTNVTSAFGWDVLCQFGVIAIVLAAATTMPAMPTAVAMLCVAFFCDVWSSGPVGLYAMAFMASFAVAWAFIGRTKTERVIALMVCSALVCMLFEGILAVIYSIYYWDTHFLSVFLHQSWMNALMTACLTPLVMWAMHGIEKLFIRRKTAIS